MSNDNPFDSAKFAKRAFKFAVALKKHNETPEAKAHRDWLAMVTAADEIVEREAKAKATADAIVRAGRRRRNEET